MFNGKKKEGNKKGIKKTEVTEERQHTQAITLSWQFWIFYSPIRMVPRIEMDYRTTLTNFRGKIWSGTGSLNFFLAK